MELRQLRLFLKVIEHGNNSAAADSLSMPQPVLSRHIARIEKEFSAKLLNRLPRGVAPNKAGKILQDHASSIDANYRNALRQIAALQSASAGVVNDVGTGQSWLRGPLSAGVARLVAKNPAARIKIVAGATDTLPSRLLRGEFDMILAPVAIVANYGRLYDA